MRLPRKTTPGIRSTRVPVQSLMDHPNIAKLYEWFEDEPNGEVCIIMEHLTGGSLEQHVMKYGRIFDEEETSVIMSQVHGAFHDPWVGAPDVTQKHA